jgi:LPXTG-motif cell wall-anchored protein
VHRHPSDRVAVAGPGQPAAHGHALIAAVFDTDGDGKGDTTVLIEPGAGDGDDIVTVGHSKAYAITGAGWTLVDANATITGEADKFVLTHTCAATRATTPPTSSSTRGTAATTPAESTGSGSGGSGTSGEASGGLPTTGANAGGAAVVGLTLIGGGAVLVLRRRRRFVA